MYKNCIVFDFDCTITKRHFYHFLNSPRRFLRLYKHLDKDQVIKLRRSIKPYFEGTSSRIQEGDLSLFIDIIFGGFGRYKLLRHFFKRLVKLGIELNISSKGEYDEIINCLSLLDLKKYFTFLNSYGTTGLINQNCDKFPTKGKIDFFKSFIFGNYEKIIYIDDDHNEHQAMKNAHDYIFIGTLDKEIGGGISLTEIKLIESKLGIVDKGEVNNFCLCV